MDNKLLDLEESQNKLELALQHADNIIMRKYMTDIKQYPIKHIDSEMENIPLNSVLRLFKIEKLVYDVDENNQDKLMSVYNSIALCGGSLIHIISSDGNEVNYYIGTKTNNLNDISICQSVLSGTFEGNFPGSKLVKQDKNETIDCVKNIFNSKTEKEKIVSVVNGVPGFRNEEKKEFVQGMEKLIDSMKGERFTLITIADSVSKERIENIKENYEMLYSQLSPFAKSVQTYSLSESDAVAESISSTVTKTVGKTISNTTSSSESTTKGKNKSLNGSIIVVSGSFGTSSSVSNQQGISKGTSDNKSQSKGETKGNTDTHTITSGKTMQLSYENKRITDLLKQIEKQIERIDDSKDIGLWNTAAYCIADDEQTSKMLAGTIQALCRGKKQTIENYSINTWTNEYQLAQINKYLCKLKHPQFQMTDFENITPTSLINGKELTISAGLPQKSINGVAVSKMTSFARNIVVENEENMEQTIEAGNIYHMGKVENNKVVLDKESLSAHVLITGSTGSGKSNTVYTMIQELQKKKVKFLIIEPAKGEYKNIFGNRTDVNVFGTNSKYCELLKINPFSFPEDIHILEHVDRLVEIFNVCWPMYAAMPAVLKDAILCAYRKCGWNLETSENVHEKRYYPTCIDLQKQIVQVINSSAYSEELKGNYIGSLATRINSLTNGLNGQMFVSNEIDENTLFDENTIIDLSRVGSQETKSLIMGIMVMKLNEYRMSKAHGKMNQPLKHVTILEEAHNLLRNVSKSSTSSEEGGMAQKSVEMLSNSIAEMRTYGEGFIIVDQSPGAIDISAIRNTNTKIIMRLPEEHDRQQAGKAAALSEKQISELAKLPKGVAVIYQNNWLEPVLCKINKADIKDDVYYYNSYNDKSCVYDKQIRKMIVMLLVGNRVDEVLDINPDELKENIDYLKISTENKIHIVDLVTALENGNEPMLFKDDMFVELSKVVCEILQYESFKFLIEDINDEVEIQNCIDKIIGDTIGQTSDELKLAIAQCVIRNLVNESNEKVDLYSRWREFAMNKRKMVVQ